MAHEKGNLNDLRAILGNDVAIKASRAGTLPYPDGIIIARLAWSYNPLEESEVALLQTALEGFDGGLAKRYPEAHEGILLIEGGDRQWIRSEIHPFEHGN